MTTSGNDGACGRAFMAQTGRFGFRFHVITSCWCVLSGAPPVVGRAQRRHASAGAMEGASLKPRWLKNNRYIMSPRIAYDPTNSRFFH